MHLSFKLILCLALTLMVACREDSPSSSTDSSNEAPSPKAVAPVPIPQFDARSAYGFIEKQLSFGPRSPDSPGHEACLDWMESQFESYGARVIRQSFKARKLDGGTYEASNLIASFNPEFPDRVLLSAHWDTRAVADYDPDQSKRLQPIPGADDGGSGVAVLLEIARQLQAQPIPFGVDIVLFDAEDQGRDGGGDTYSWCQGAQYWGRQTHVPNYKARFGIHLDMVGARHARFAREGYSRQYAPQVLDKVWKLAQGMGYGMYFVDDPEPPVTDDHLFVNEYARIPTINIIHKALGSQTGFGPHWHTHGDDISVIDQRTLKGVGQVVLAVVYNTYMGRL